ncbi:MAG: response regulator transcription factor [Lachnospiraceae bacterium]|nr:response regulator transcription factor [Lachnospiraceae bacterium]
MRLLFAEDEADLNRIVCERLTDEGYSVDACHDGEEAMDFLDMAEYDGVILDVMMPKADGFTVLQHLRKNGNQTPVLFLTARDAVADRVKGLDLGADDYLVKPFALEELMARVRALTRRSFNEADSKLTCADLVMDTAAHTVTRGGKEILLSAKEYQLLEYLMHNKGIVLTRDRIEDHIWNFDYEGGTNVVDVYISYLRKKIDGGFEEKLIRTVRGAGYQLRDE